MFPRALRITRIRGVDVRVDPTWLLIAVLVLWSFLVRWSVTGRPGVVSVAMAVAATLGFFGSVLAHELGHAMEARHRDLQVHGITLFLFGGVTEMDMHTRRPRDEFTVAAIGPWTSLVLASALGLVTAALDWYAPGRAPELAQVTGTLGWVNLGLALFNIVPGAPLDGGRVLRAGLWALTGDRHRAQLIAARAGQVLAITIWAAGAWWVLRSPAGLLFAVWIGFVGFFMFNAARTELAQARTLRLVEGHTAGLFASSDRPAVAAGTTLDRVDLEMTTTRGEDRYAVIADDRLVGVLTTSAVAAVDPADQHLRTVADVMTRAEDLPAVPHDAPVLDALLQLHDHEVVAVVRDGAVVGLVDRARADAALRRLQRLRRERDDDAGQARTASSEAEA
jgi:Zn-dependent protease/CBS domain-containing protein